MLNIKMHKNNSGDFQNGAIEFQNEETLHLITSGLIQKLNFVEDTIKNAKTDIIKEMYRKKFNQIEDMLNKLDKPTIVKNENSKLIKQMKEMEVVYKTVDGFS